MVRGIKISKESNTGLIRSLDSPLKKLQARKLILSFIIPTKTSICDLLATSASYRVLLLIGCPDIDHGIL